MAAEYEVLKIDELSRARDSGGIQKYYRHQIRTTAGTVLTADIAEEHFTEDVVAKILTALAIKADKIKAR